MNVQVRVCIHIHVHTLRNEDAAAAAHTPASTYESRSALFMLSAHAVHKLLPRGEDNLAAAEEALVLAGVTSA